MLDLFNFFNSCLKSDSFRKCANWLHLAFPLGLVQGMITGIRGLCNGLGPALYGFIFFLFDVELSGIAPIQTDYNIPLQTPSEVGACQLFNDNSGFATHRPFLKALVLHMDVATVKATPNVPRFMLICLKDYNVERFVPFLFFFLLLSKK